MTSAERHHPLEVLQRRALYVGAIGAGAWLIGGASAALAGDAALQQKLFFSYLYAYCFCLSMPLGCLAVWMLHQQTGGAWGLAIHRCLEAGARMIPLMAILFLPLVLGLGPLYVWMHPEQVHEQAIRQVIEQRAGYMSPAGFILRACVYFAVWSFLALRLDRWQVEQDRAWDPARARRMQVLSGPGLGLYGLAVTFAAIDWLMSLEPEFFSTIFGVLIGIAQALPAYAFAVALSTFLAEWPADEADRMPIAAAVWNDVGNLMLALVMLWAYMSFSQLLLIWSGNLPEEIVWYLRRSQYGWQYVALFLAVFYFAVPFGLLLSRPLKRDPRRLRLLALGLVGVSAVHYFWLVNPVYAARIADSETGGPIGIHWLDLAALAALGGVTLALFVWQLRRRPLAPPYAPDPVEATQHA